MSSSRDLSLDAFRGLTVMMMILVNLQGNGDAAYATLKHAEWHGLTFADLIFPWFLFIVGLSVPLAMDRMLGHSRWPAVLKRTAILFALGVVLAWLIRPVEFDQIRWMGVLQRIAIVYLACAAVAILTRGWAVAAGIALAALVVHSLLLFVPVAGLDSLTAGNGLSGWLDREYLPGRLLRKSWDPEGLLSTLPAVASGLLGLAFMRAKPTEGVRIAMAIAMMLAGWIIAKWVPVNKALWTASFVMITAGSALAVWTVMRRVWARMGNSRLADLAVLFGQTALTFYVIHMLLLAIIVRKLPDGTRIWDWLFANLSASGMAPPVASLLFAMIAGAICAAPLVWLKKHRLLIKA